MSTARPRVALIVETSTAYGRRILDGISRYLAANQPWSIFVEERELNSAPPDWLTSWDGDGIICRPMTPELAANLKRLKIHVVDLNDRYGYLGFPQVGSDMVQLGTEAAKHLKDRGFTNIAYCGFADERWSELRKQGVASRTQLAHIFERPLLSHRQGDWGQDQDELTAWVNSLPKPVGIVACNDHRALGVLDACERLGLIVPGQVSVVGIDNSETFCSLCNPSLTSVIPDATAVGFEAAAMLDSMLNAPKANIPSRLVQPKGIAIRQSSDSIAVADPLVAQASRYIRDNLHEKIDVSAIANFAKVSRSTLERRFRTVMGYSPHAEVSKVRLAKCLKLLAETNWPLVRIADSVGFAHPEYLISVIKRATGMTPSQYRMTKKHN